MPSQLPIELTVKDNYEIEYTITAYQKDKYKNVFDYFIDAEGDIYYSYSSLLDRQEKYRVGQFFDKNYQGKEPVYPVQLVIFRFEQYLDGTGRVVVELDQK
ncbi:hypothetical protein [Bacillus ndiopicus]|uniref:hypothetical protein n=1 Tax=Bacillus ndiopicus TaxID=1347368 RepID=UPI0005A876E6|nr:hypothetical protein [Bacillus ndiopicus]